MTYIEKICKEKGVKLTTQRKVIASVLFSSDDHPDAEEIYKRSNIIDPKISLATVYRALSLFEDYGLIKRLEIHKGKSRYEQFDKSRQHYHLIDLDSGEIVEFQDPKLEAIYQRIAQELGYDLKDFKLELYGQKIEHQDK